MSKLGLDYRNFKFSRTLNECSNISATLVEVSLLHFIEHFHLFSFLFFFFLFFFGKALSSEINYSSYVIYSCWEFSRKNLSVSIILSVKGDPSYYISIRSFHGRFC